MATIASRSSSERRARRARPPEQPAPARETAALLERLTRFRAGRYRVVSCYLKLEPRDRARGKFLIKLKNRARAVEAGLGRLGLDRDVEEAVRRDLARVLEYLRTPGGLPAAHGVAVFACGPVGLFEVAPLAVVHRSRLAVDPTPLVRELASLEDEFGRILTAVVDRTSARFFVVGASSVEELPGLTTASPPSRKTRRDRALGESNYNNRIREERQRHFEAVARQLFLLDRNRPVHGIVLAGTGVEASAVEPFLHSYLAERLLGTTRLNPRDVTAAGVHAATLAVREGWERAREREQVEELANAVGAGWAVNGVDDTLRALARGQARVLLVDADAALPGFRVPGTGRLARQVTELDGTGPAEPVIDVVDDAIEEGLRQHLDVNVVYEPAARAHLDGLAALLRFR